MPNPMSIGTSIALAVEELRPDNLGVPISNNFGALIAKVREKKGMNQGELAKAAGISQPSLSAIENGETQPNQVKLVTIWKIASALGVSIDEITAEKTGEGNVESRPPPRSRLPLISWVSAGMRENAFDPYAPGTAAEWIDFDAPASKSAFCLRVRGDSMVRPDGTGFPDGSYIAVEPRRMPKSGEYAVFRFNDADEATFKQYVTDGPLKLLKPLNPSYPTIALGPDAQLVGTVFEKRIIERF